MREPTQREVMEMTQREIFANVSTLVNFILSLDLDDKPFTIDDIETEVPLEQQIEYLESIGFNFGEEGDFDPEYDEDEIAIAYEEETADEEIYEWYIVSGWLLRKLGEKGESVAPSHRLWGRKCTGQAVYHDNVMVEICAELNARRHRKDDDNE